MLVPRTRPAFALGGRVTTTRPWSRCTYMTTSGKRSDPLRILFCGSDTFSTEALHALYEEHRFNPELVQSIDVVVPPAKMTGRGLKKKSVVPAQKMAESMKLPYYEIPTFTGWEMPKGINLIVAVSFGLFVPPRLLKQAKYGGLNVHPSFLPDLRGPAPIHHAVLRGDDYVGVSLQTLDAAHFDHGVILSQTERPGLRATRHWTLNLLTRKLAIEGSELLVEGLRQGLHVPPYSNAAAVADNDDGADEVPGQRQQQRQQQERQGLRHAPKIRTSDTEIRWDAWTADDWARRLQMKQAIWTKGQSQGTQGPSSRRLIIHDSRLVPEEEVRGKRGIIEVSMTTTLATQQQQQQQSTTTEMTSTETTTITTAAAAAAETNPETEAADRGENTSPDVVDGSANAGGLGDAATLATADALRCRITISVDSRNGDAYFLLGGGDGSSSSSGGGGGSSSRAWIRVRRATLEGRDEKPAAVAVRPFIVEWHQDAAPVKAKD